MRDDEQCISLSSSTSFCSKMTSFPRSVVCLVAMEYKYGEQAKLDQTTVHCTNNHWKNEVVHLQLADRNAYILGVPLPNCFNLCF